MSGEKGRVRGAEAEEALRLYFLATGYYVEKGIAFKFSGFDVTDLDLFLYSKASALTRERINVDIKRKRTPQAIERIFWTKGLCEVLDFDKCMIATTDKKKQTRDFGRLHGVTVLDGGFLERVIKHYKSNDRITEAQLIGMMGGDCESCNGRKLKDIYINQKELLAGVMGFNSINKLLYDLNGLLRELTISTNKKEILTRMTLATIARILILFDFVSRSYSSADVMARKEMLEEGLRYGDAGKERAIEVIDSAIRLIAKVGQQSLFERTDLQREFDSQAIRYPAGGLAEFIALSETQKKLFDTSREFHDLAFRGKAPGLSNLVTLQKSFLGCFLDFFKLDRRDFI